MRYAIYRTRVVENHMDNCNSWTQAIIAEILVEIEVYVVCFKSRATVIFLSPSFFSFSNMNPSFVFWERKIQLFWFFTVFFPCFSQRKRHYFVFLSYLVKFKLLIYFLFVLYHKFNTICFDVNMVWYFCVNCILKSVIWTNFFMNTLNISYTS